MTCTGDVTVNGATEISIQAGRLAPLPHLYVFLNQDNLHLS